VLSHLHQYVDCLALLEPLYNQLEPLDEGAAITICLLMVHMWLEARQPDKVRTTVLCQHMENPTCLLCEHVNALETNGSGANASPASHSLCCSRARILPHAEVPSLTSTAIYSCGRLATSAGGLSRVRQCIAVAGAQCTQELE